MQKYYSSLIVISFVLSIISVLLLWLTNQKLATLICDIRTGFSAERQFTYPILRTIGDPINYGKQYTNPLMTKNEYNILCPNS